MNQGKLKNTNALVISPMEADLEAGRELRSRIKKQLAELGINVWDHYSRPFINEIEENEETHNELIKARECGNYELINSYRDIRRQDLSLVDTADFIICVFEKKTFSVGTWNEFFLADSLRKPIFFVWGEGKDKCPLWLFWTLPHSYIYSSVIEALETIKAIDSGQIEIDSKRWRLKKPEFR